jgi:hypothetical protein
MIEKITKTSNPLTIIAVFAGLAEIAATIAIGFVDSELQKLFIWYVMLFPILLVILFFVTLNFNTKALYAPSDFRSDEGYLSLNKQVEQFRKNALGKSEEKRNLSSLPSDKILIDILHHLHPQARKYLLGVVGKNLTFKEHVDIVRELKIPFDLDGKNFEAHPKFQYAISLGYVMCFTVNYMDYLFIITKQNDEDQRFTLRMRQSLIDALKKMENSD